MIQRINIYITGAVQGVGFRPFIYRLAKSLQLNGYVLNSTTGVTIEAEGPVTQLEAFLLNIEKEKPARAIIQSLEFSYLDPSGYSGFRILESRKEKEISAYILPDIAVCQACLEELYDPSDRRYLYPFINCTHCGPRFSIIESLPYDRPNTSMKIFPMCSACRAEYENPGDRRFHAQPVACPECGPHLELWDESGTFLSAGHEALQQAAGEIRRGKILALKGLGGFHLVVDATNTTAVEQLRFRKLREEKPFALMFPGLTQVTKVCQVSPFEERLLLSPESPIVLLRRKKRTSQKLSPAIAPQNPCLGIMLPYTPLHHLLLHLLDFPIVATSGNISEEPMSIDEQNACQKLSGIADYYLIHNRPITRHVDDSIARIILGREMILRRARGYAPLPVRLPGREDLPDQAAIATLAVGAQLKNTVALSAGRNVFISQHIGDLSTESAYRTFRKVIKDFQELYRVKPDQVVSDMHPDYLSSKFVREKYSRPISVQHHEAHIAACRLENQITGEALGISWDGTGLGRDGTIWGGEFFFSDDSGIKHIAQFRQFPLPGGEQAIREPRRSALGILYAVHGEKLFSRPAVLQKFFSASEISLLRQMLEKKINCPLTSSVGRLFDGVASLLEVRQIINYEGQAAMMLEYLADPRENAHYQWDWQDREVSIIDWAVTLEQILKDLETGLAKGKIAMKFHNTLSKIILQAAQKTGISKVVMSGGCFQNVILLEKTVRLLRAQGLQPYWHQRVPPNDGGISLGQIALASRLQPVEKTGVLQASEKTSN